MIPNVSLRKALADPELLGSVLAGPSWRAWRVLLIAAMGERLTKSERALFTQLTGREREPLQRVEEFEAVVGRRGGKSRAISVVTTYITGLCQHPALVRGERGVCLVIAQDQRTADIVLDYITAAFEGSPILSQLVDQRTQRTLRLTNGIDVEVRAADFRRLRGPTYIAVIADEVAFWMNEYSANPDDAILNSVRPGLSTTNGPLFMISSPYSKKGELWRTYQRHFGRNGDPLILVAQGASRTFNPTLPQRVVDRAMERDPVANRAEYLAEFRVDISSFVRVEAVRACVAEGVFERPPQAAQSYFGFADPSGSGADSFTLGIGHLDYAKQTIVVDCLREVRPPFSPEQVCSEFADVLKSYRIASIVGDHYASIWPVEQFGRFGIDYQQSASPRSTLYQNMLPMLNSCRIELLDHPRLIAQLCALERRTARGGRDSIDHPQIANAHDDLANVIAGLAAQQQQLGGFDPTYAAWQEDFVDRDLVDSPASAMKARALKLADALLSGRNPDDDQTREPTNGYAAHRLV